MIPIAQRKLGKKPAVTDPRTFKLNRYLVTKNLPIPPSHIDWTPADRGGWPMFLNDQYGCCAIASPGHLTELWTANASATNLLKDSDILEAYEAVGGYVPGDASTDNGCVMLDVLKFWRKTGIGGHQIQAFIQVNPKDPVEIQTALWLFGGLYSGFALPVSVQTQKDVWDVVAEDGGTWGGHAVAMVATNQNDKKIITWGEVQLITSGFVSVYCDELYAVLSQDWISKAGLSPSGFDAVQLNDDLAALNK